MNLVLSIKVNLIASNAFSLSINSFFSLILFLSKGVILYIKKMKNEEKINSNYSDWGILLKMEKNKWYKKAI